MARNVPSKKATIETLATMVAKGFSDVTSAMATKEGLNGLRSDIENNYATKEELKFEINNLKEDIEIMLGKHVGTFRNDYDELARRVKELEKKVIN
ncbi:MAG: hypothetical protein Q7R89_03905 [bacterium]|nr:hypothetical protein [bacterium]